MRPLAITMGEPSGIGGELTLKAWSMRRGKDLPPFFAIDDPARLEGINPEVPIQVIERAEQAAQVFEKALPVLPIALKEKSIAGRLNRPVAKVMGFTGNRYCDSMMRALEALSSCRSLTHNTFYTSANSAV